MMDRKARVPLLQQCWREGWRQRERDIQIPDPITGDTIDNPWYYYDRMYRGFQWDFIPSMASWVSRPVKNTAFMAVEAYTTLLTDNDPAFTVASRHEGNEDLAETIRYAVEYWWEQEEMQGKVALAVKASRQFGIGWMHVYRDSVRKKACCKVISPEHILVDPDCTVEDFDPTWLIYEYRTQVGALRKAYDLTDEDMLGFDCKWKPQTGSSERSEYDRYEDNINPATSVAVYELWTKDPETIEWTDEVDGKEVKKSKPMYRGGRRTLYAGGLVIEDGPNPYKHGMFPFTPFHAYPVPGRFYGIGDIQGLLPNIVLRNRMSQFIFDQTSKSGGGFILVGQRSGIDPNTISNKPIQILPCLDVNQFKIESAKAPSRHVFEYIYMLDKDSDDVVGLHDISRGVANPSRKTAEEVAVLAESDRTRVRSASRWLTWAVRRIGVQVLSCWAQWPDFKWMMEVAGKDIVPMDNENGFEAPELTVREFDPKALKAAMKGDKLPVELKVVDTSMLPSLMQDRNAQVTGLMQMGVLTPEDVLKYNLIPIPHRESIMADRARLIAEQEAMQAPPVPAEGVGAPESLTPMPPMGNEVGVPTDLASMPPEAIMAAAEQLAGETGMSPEEIIQQTIGLVV